MQSSLAKKINFSARIARKMSWAISRSVGRLSQLASRGLVASSASKPRVDVDGQTAPPLTQFSEEEQALKESGTMFIDDICGLSVVLCCASVNVGRN